jgi:hypothetical protein
METVAESRDASHHSVEPVDELRSRIEALWRYSAPEANPQLQRTWRDLQRLEQMEIKRLKQMILDRIEKGEYPNEF